MSSSPRFWQKLGLGKQNKSSTSVISDKQDRVSLHSVQSTISLNDTHHESNGKHLKRFSTLSLRYKASTPSFRHSKNTPAIPEPVPLKKSQTSNTIEYTRKQSITDTSDEPYFEDNKSYMEESSIGYKGKNVIDNNVNKKDKYSFSSPRRQSSESMYSYHSQKSPRLSNQQAQIPIRQSSQRESTYALSSPPHKLVPRLKPSRSNQSLKSTSTNTSGRASSEHPSTTKQASSKTNTSRLRKPSPASSNIPRSDSNASLISYHNNNNNKKSQQRLERIPHSSHNSSDENESCGSHKQLTRSSSNGSSFTTERKRRSHSLQKKTYPTTLEESQYLIESLKEDLEKEKLASRALQGQKEAISKDLDYFCEQADEMTLERDEYKRKYEEEKEKNEQFMLINDQSQTGTQLEMQLETVQQELSEHQYRYYTDMQAKNDEIQKLKSDLRQSQIQLQVLRKTMEQMLKADGREILHEDDIDYKITRKKSFYDDDKYLLLQSGYHPDHHSSSSVSSKCSNNTKPTTNPPSPTPCYTQSEDESPYGFLNDPFIMDNDIQHRFAIAKRKSEDYSKKLELSRRRKDQIEEMLGEVDSQLSRVKQKIRSPSSCEK